MRCRVSIWGLICWTTIRKQAASNNRGTIRLQQTEPGTSGAQPAFFASDTRLARVLSFPQLLTISEEVTACQQ
jgi:hypothetical protein